MKVLGFVNLQGFLMKGLLATLKVLMSKEEVAALRVCGTLRELEDASALKREHLGGSAAFLAQF